MTSLPTPLEIEAAKARERGFDQLRQLSRELETALTRAADARQARNQEIYRLRSLPSPPTIMAIAEVAQVRHGYVSRIVQGKGQPASGHAT